MNFVKFLKKINLNAKNVIRTTLSILMIKI